MTLIAQVFSENHSFFAICDTLISVNQAVDGNPEALPLQHGLGLNFGTHGVRCASKAVLFGNYLVLWAGDVNSARNLINEFKKLQDPSLSDFKRTIDKNPIWGNEVRLIYACNDGSICWSGDWGCETAVSGEKELISAGTGAEAFLDLGCVYENNLSSAQSSEEMTPVDFILDRFGKLTQQELVSYLHKYEYFGGAYELFDKKDGGGFKRVNYSISEISNRLHLEGKWSEFISDTRVVQAIGRRDRSIFLVWLISADGRHRVTRFDVFDITAPESVGHEIRQSELISEMSFCYVIGTQFYWEGRLGNCFHSFFVDKKSGGLKISGHKADISEMVSSYYQQGGGVHNPNDGAEEFGYFVSVVRVFGTNGSLN